MAKVTIYHNPRCSKSREALSILEEQGIEPDIIRYLDDSPSVAELRDVLGKAGLAPIEAIRTKEARAKELGIGVKTYSDDELLQLMSENPVLIERPIVIKGRKAIIARPPERVHDIL